VRRRPNREVLLLAGLVAVGAAVRFATLGDRSFWVDEGSTVALMRLPLGDMLHRWYVREDTPPLYYLLAYGWTRIFGTTEAGVRSLSAVLGVATIPLAYVATARLATRRAGLVAAAIVSVSALDVWFSQDARGYALVVLAAGLSFWAFLAARESPTPRRLAVWAAASTLTLLTHYFAGWLVAAEAVWLLAAHPSARRAVVAACALPAAAFAGLVPVALVQRSEGGAATFLSASSLASRVVQVPAQYVVAFQPPAQVIVSLAAFLAVPVALWLVLRRADARERSGALVAATVGAAAVLGPIAMALAGYDYVLTRNTAVGFVPLLAVVAIGLGARAAGWLGAAALLWLAGFSVAVDLVTADHPKFDHDDWRAAARAVGVAPGRRVVVLNPPSGSIVFAIYLPRARFTRGPPGRVEEIDVIGLPPATRQIGQTPKPPRPPTPPAPAGFAVAQRRDAATFTLVRYRAPRPEAVTRTGLDALALSGGESPSLVIVPGRRAPG
jgi:mannosyltransferase